MTPERLITGPAFDLTRTRDGLAVRIALSDVRPEDVDVEVRGDWLTVRAQTRHDRSIDRYGTFFREQCVGLWERTLRLPFRVDSRRAEAKLVGSTLTIQLPRAEGIASRLKRRLQRALHAIRPPRRQTVRVRVA